MTGRKSLTRPATALLTLCCVLACLTACGGERVVLLPADAIVRAGPGMRGRVWTETPDGSWALSKNKVAIPEGMYILTLTPEEEKANGLPPLPLPASGPSAGGER